MEYDSQDVKQRHPIRKEAAPAILFSRASFAPLSRMEGIFIDKIHSKFLAKLSSVDTATRATLSAKVGCRIKDHVVMAENQE